MVDNFNHIKRNMKNKYVVPIVMGGSLIALYFIYFSIIVVLNNKSVVEALKETCILGVIATLITFIVLKSMSKKEPKDRD